MDYEAIEPFGDRRADWQAASICTAFANITLASKGAKKRFRVSDFLLEFDTEDKKVVTKEGASAPPAKTWQEMKFIAQMWAAAFNADEDKKRKRRR